FTDENLKTVGSISLANDNSKLYAGLSQDSSVYFDGTDLILLPNDGATTAQVKVVQNRNVDAVMIATTATTADVIDVDGTTLTDGAILKATVDDTLNAGAAIIDINGTAVNNDVRLMEISTTPGNGADVYLAYLERGGNDATIYYDEASDLWWMNQGAGGADIQIASATSGGATTDGGTVTYVTGQTDDFAVGGTTSAADFFFDQSLGDLYINTGSLSIQSDGEKLYFGAGDDASIYVDTSNDMWIANTTSDEDISIVANNGGVITNMLFVDGSESRVGIGTSTPSVLLDVSGGDVSMKDTTGAFTLTLDSNATNNPTEILISNAGTTEWSIQNRASNSTPADSLVIYKDGTVNEANAILSLTTEDYVGINDSTPNAHLEVSSDGTTGGSIFMLSSNDDTDGDFMIVAETGKVGIGITLPVEKLQVSGSVSFDGALLTTGSITINADNYALNFGAGQDASIYYDGSDLDIIATGTVNFTDENLITVGNISLAADNARLYVGQSQDASIYYDGSNMNLAATGSIDFTDENLITVGSISLGNDNSTLYFGKSQDASIYYDGSDLDIIATGTVNFTDENLITDGNISIDADNSKLYLGENQEASIYYDSTESDLVIKTQESGSGDLIVLDGNMGIGTPSPNERLEVNNTIVYSNEYNAGSADPYTVDWGNGNKQVITLDANNSIVNFTNPAGGVANFLLRIIQDGVGGRNITSWDADIKWPGGSAPALSSGIADVDIVSCYYNGTNYYCTPSFDFY
ncbi:MAG: hypothetical protein KKD07_04755, partial [Candidatus Omnitrophica bacterium]|nr:hypothetical protein [Candidatus Omnitrophota bacterium]